MMKMVMTVPIKYLINLFCLTLFYDNNIYENKIMSSCSPPHKYNFNKTASSTCGSFITASQTQFCSANNKHNFFTHLKTTKNKLFTRLTERHKLLTNKTNNIINNNITNKFALKTPKITGTQFPTISRDAKLNNLSPNDTSSPQHNNNENNIEHEQNINNNN